MSSHDALLPLSDLHHQVPPSSEPFSAPISQGNKRPYSDGVDTDTKRARVGYSSTHIVDEEAKRRGLMEEVRTETNKSASASAGGTAGNSEKDFAAPNDRMKRKELLFKDITKLPVLNAPSLWYGNERVKTRGVFHQPSGRFKASLRVNGKDIYLGQYACEELACQAYDRFAIKVHGVDGDHRLNFGIVWYKEDIPLIEKTSLEQLVQEIREDAKILNKRAITLRKSQKNNRTSQSQELNINTLLQQNYLMEQMRGGRQEKMAQQPLALHSTRDDMGVPNMPMVSGMPVLHYPVQQGVIPQEQTIQHNAYNTILANALLQNPNPISQGLSAYTNQVQPSSMSRLPNPNNNGLILPSMFNNSHQQMFNNIHQQMHQPSVMLNQSHSVNPGQQGIPDPRYR